MRRLFKVGNDRHDVGRVTFSWHPDGNFLASAGRNGIIRKDFCCRCSIVLFVCLYSNVYFSYHV